jgi:hypothetical protein
LNINSAKNKLLSSHNKDKIDELYKL